MLKTVTKKWPLRRAKSISASQLKDSSTDICIVEGPNEMHDVSKSNKEFKLRMWCYMKPPKISRDVPSAVNPIMLEKVRNVLTGDAGGDRACQSKLESKLNIQVRQDGAICREFSRIETKMFPPGIRTCKEY